MATVPSGQAAATASTGGPSAPPAALKISDFQVLSKLGEGGFGTVLLAKKKSSGKLYALKVLEKRNMRMRGIAERVIAECETLQRIHHPFVVQMHYAFQDRSRVVFVLEHVAGGDLFTYLQERQAFPESWCRIYTAELSLALSWVHTLGYVYRDLKAENVLVARDGHLKLADFGTAKRVQQPRASPNPDGSPGSAGAPAPAPAPAAAGPLHTIVGTPEFLAPELFLEDGYGFSVDWWGLGALLSEMLLGDQVIVSHGDGALRALVDAYRKGTHLKPLPPWVSEEAASLLRGLLTVRKSARIACGEAGLAELQAHPFFGPTATGRAPLDWNALYRKEIDAPLRPFAAARSTREMRMDDEEGATSPGVTAEGDELAQLEARFVGYYDAADDAAYGEGGWSSLLCDTAARGDCAALRELLGSGAPVDEMDYDRRTAIHLAASQGHLEAVTLLIDEAGADPSPVDRWGGTPLDDAIRSGHGEVVAFLLGRGAKKGQRRVGARSATEMKSAQLCDSAARGELERLRAMVEREGYDVDLGDYDHRTAIHLAASEGMLGVVRATPPPLRPLLTPSIPSDPLPSRAPLLRCASSCSSSTPTRRPSTAGAARRSTTRSARATATSPPSSSRAAGSAARRGARAGRRRGAAAARTT